jgi:hypothetical protein
MVQVPGLIYGINPKFKIQNILRGYFKSCGRGIQNFRSSSILLKEEDFEQLITPFSSGLGGI